MTVYLLSIFIIAYKYIKCFFIQWNVENYIFISYIFLAAVQEYLSYFLSFYCTFLYFRKISLNTCLMFLNFVLYLPWYIYSASIAKPFSILLLLFLLTYTSNKAFWILSQVIWTQYSLMAINLINFQFLKLRNLNQHWIQTWTQYIKILVLLFSCAPPLFFSCRLLTFGITLAFFLGNRQLLY